LRFSNSGLTDPSFTTPEEVVRAHGAVQAQDYGPTKWAVGLRARNLADADVDAAVTSGAIVRTHVLRPTWHFVAREDLRWMLALTGPRVLQGSRSRFRDLGLDARTLARCEKTITSELVGGNRMTRTDIGAILERKKLDPDGQRLHWIVSYLELEAVISSGGYEGKKHTYALLDERVPKGHRFDRDKAVIDLLRRYLAAHGPATIKDFGWWSSLTAKDIRSALDSLGDEVESHDLDGMTLWSIAGDGASPPKVTGAHLLQPFDELIVGYTQSRYFGDPKADQARAAWGGRSPLRGVIFVNGKAVGQWRRLTKKGSFTIEAATYDDLGRASTKAIEKEVGRYASFGGIPTTLQLTRF
jgi:winged helix DNA-binding protein